MLHFARGAEAECVVPHTFVANGVRIDTDCGPTPLRLSAKHLVFAVRGLVQAHLLHVGDELWGDLAQTRVCRVLGVAADLHQRYMGLNCLESEVVADGVKVSTFEWQHTIAALWMKYVSAVAGLRFASKMGDALVHALVQFSSMV